MVNNDLKMKLKYLKIFLVISTLIPSTIHGLICVFGLIGMIIRFNQIEAVYLLIFVLGILGYIGLIMQVFEERKEKNSRLFKITCLVCGALSILIFILIHREQAWDWIKTFEEPLECMLIIYPAISYILLPFILVYELKKANINETDF